jgi:DNA-binding SARP family transcriptional activator
MWKDLVLTVMQAYLFGDFRISTDTHSGLELRPTAARLFAFLLLHRQHVHLREVVAEAFWEDTGIDRARKNLNTTLWQLRNALCQADDSLAKVIAATPDQIKINQEANLWLDVAWFEDKAKRGLAHSEAGISSAAIDALEEAVALYQGDLLTCFYDPWVLHERERLRLIYLRCLTRLMEHHKEQHNLDASIGYAQHILHIEPWREDIHRTLMTLYAESGRRADALEQYKICRQSLASELDVSPMPETDALYQRLLTNAHISRGQTVATPLPLSTANAYSADGRTLQEATAQLQAAIQTLQNAQRALEYSVALVERLVQS